MAMELEVKTPSDCYFRNVGGTECNLTQGQCENDKEFPNECPLRKSAVLLKIKAKNEQKKRNELVFARQFRKLLDNKTLGAGKWMELAYQYGIQACDLIESLRGEELIWLFTDIRELMISDAETIAGEFGGGEKWEEYCKNTKAIIDKIDNLLGILGG